MKGFSWERMAAIVICLAAGIGLLWLGFFFVLKLLLPFLLAWGLSLAITPLSERLAKKLRLPQKLLAVLLLTLSLSGLVLLLGLAVNRLLRELQALAATVLENAAFSNVVSRSFDYFEEMTAGIALFDRIRAGENYAVFRERFNGMINDLLVGTGEAVTARLPYVAGQMLTALPSVLLFLAVTVISGFYFCMDRRQLEQTVGGLLPAALKERLPAWRAGLRHFAGKYLRAYLLLLLLTFAELFLGLTLLRVEYAFLLAGVIAVVDLLPVLGVGTVLVPWAVVALLQRDTVLGIGLLILFLAVTVLRQIIEPHLIGQSLGLHPLLTLAAGYLGWQLLGVLGMAIGPLLALLIKSLCSAYRKNEKSV